MAEGFVLNISKEMLQRLDAADKKIVQIGESAEKAMKKINEAFGKKLTGVEDFIKQLNDIQQQLSKKDLKVNVDLALKNGALDSLKKQIEALGITIPVGVTATGTGGSNSAGVVPNGLDEALSRIATTIDAMNKTLASVIKVQPTSFTPQQQGTLSKKANTAAYREQINAIQQVIYAEKEKARVERENDKKAQIAHRERMTQLQQQEREIMRLAKTYRSMPSSINYVGGLIHESKQATTVNQMITAIRNLKNAKKDLDTTDSRYKKNVQELNKEIRRQESELRKLGHQLDNVNKRSRHLFDITGQLGRALSLMFSVSQITQYVSKMVNVRKEMELQQRSLQVLLQNKDKANELWNQTLDLAVKSPFRVKELVTYTKQLAAYRIESDKLFETNKMLADVSAGLGVDMQRLILAFGQVKSASFLRGTELRQFTEAGIPMLEELSKYFSEIYGKSVSVAEVFDMISKRMVTFTDVEKVFQRMTGAGGVFFNMQEELSQTTAGMISNLQDSIDLMFNEIGKKNQGLINNVIKGARYIVNNWETVGKVMKGALLILLSYKAATMDISKITKGLGADVKFLFSELKNNPLVFFQTFKGNIIMTALTAIIALVIKVGREIAKYRAGIREAIDAHAKFTDSVSKLSIEFNRLDIDKHSTDIDEYKDKLNELVGIAQQQYSIEIDFVVSDLQNIDEVKRKFNELKQEILLFNDFSLSFDIEFAQQERIGRGSGLGRGISWDIENLKNAQEDISLYFDKVNDVIAPLIENYNNLSEAEQKVVDAFKNIETNQTSGAYFNQRLQGLRELGQFKDEYWKLYREWSGISTNEAASRHRYATKKFKEKYGVDFSQLKQDLIAYDRYLQRVVEEEENLYKNLEGDLSTQIARIKSIVGDSFTEADEKEYAERFVLHSIDAKATAEEWTEEIRYEFYKKAEEEFGKKYQGFSIIPQIKTPDPIKLKPWQQTFNEEVKKAVESISGKMKTEEYDYDLFGVFSISEDLQGLSTTETKKLAELNQALDAAVERREEILGKQRNNSPLFRQDELDDINLYIEILTSLRDLVGDDEKEKSKKKNKTLKESINDDISILKSAYDKFQELNENFSSAESFEKVKQAYGKAVGEISGLTIKQSADIGNATEIITESIENYDNALVGFTKAHESFRAEAYDLGDSAITIGYGSTNKMFPDEGIVMGATITEEKAEELLRKTLDNRNDNLKKVIEEKSQELGIEINQSMYNALIDMGYQGAGTENFYTNFFDRVLDVDKGVAYISNIAEKIGGVFGEDFEHPFTESFIDAFKASDIEHRIAMMLEASNLTINGGKISKTLFGGMLKRSQDRRDLAMGSLEYDFTTLEGLKKALESLMPKAASAGEQAMNALLKAISDVDVEIGVRARIKENEKIAKEISDMFSGYEIGLELKDLNIPSNIVKDVFGEYFDKLDIDVSLDEILNKIQQFKSELDKSDIDISSQLNAENVTEESKKILQSELEGNRKRREQLTKDEEKVTEMLNKEYLERLKTYTKYLLNEQHERVKIRMETLRMLQEVEDIKEYTPAQRQTITDKIKEEERKKLAQQTWKDFEQSPMYLQLFDDIENMSTDALESVIAKMKDLYNSMLAAGVAASDLKEILNQIDKAEEVIDRRNPFRNFGKNISNVFKGFKEYEKTRKQQEEALKINNNEYEKSQLLLVSAYDHLSTLKEGSAEYKIQLSIIDLLTKQTNKLEKDVEDIETELTTTNNNISSIFNSVVEFRQQMQDIDTLVNSAGEGFLQIAEAVGGIPEETKDTVKQLVDLEHSLMNIVSGILRIIYEDKIAGIAQLVDGVVNLVVVTAGLVSGEKKLNREIEKQGRILSNLQRTYDRLNEALDEVWNTQHIKEYNAELEKNLQQQIAAQKQIVAAYEDMKGADKVGSVEWERLQEAKDELQNLYDMQQELQDNIYEKITGGIIDNTLDAISSWVDAWYDAFKETGDGLKGLEDNFNEMLLNLVKRQAVMKVAGRFIDQWNSVLERYVNNDDNLSFGEITSWANMIEQDLPALSSQLETFFKAFDGVLGDTQGNLSGLQRGVTQIQESTAQELASYLNSIRYIVMDSNIQLKTLISLSTESANIIDNPMINQLKIIAQQTSAINTLLNSLTAPHPTQSGRGLKVVI